MVNRLLRRALLAVLLPAAVGSACSAPEPGVARGEAVWNNCVPCHGAAGQGNQALGAPSIAGLPEWYIVAQLEKFEAGWRGSHPEDFIGIRMKSMARSLDLDGDRESVAAYVASLPRSPQPVTLTGGNAARGQEEYTRLCVSCHAADGSGVQTVQAPPLAGQDDWYLMGQLEKFWTGWRGAHAEDTFGQMMAVTANLVDRATALDIVAYLRTLQ